MFTPPFHVAFRRRLPNAPSVDLNAVLVEIGTSTPLTQTQTMDAIPKKRLTPEVVATLLLMDSESGYEKSYLPRNNMIRDVSSEKPHTTISIENACSHLSKSDAIQPDNIGMIEIVKKSGQPLGFSLREYDGNENDKVGGIIVSRLTAGGVVEQHSLLHVGDEILQINQVSVQGYKLSDVVAMIQIPRRLVLKVRFGKPQKNNKPTYGFNNNISDTDKTTGQRQNVDNKRITSSTQEETHLSENKFGAGFTETLSPPDFQMARRNSGRQLPAPPSQDKTPYLNGGEDNPKVPPVNYVQSGKISGRKSSRTELSQGNDNNPTFVGQNSENRTVSARNQKNQKRSTVLPVSTETKQGNEQFSRDSNQARTTRVDPGDIRFDMVTSNRSTTRPLCVQDAKLEKDITTSLDLRKNLKLDTFGSSSSLSSSGSPDRGRQIPVGGNIELSSPEMSGDSSSSSANFSVTSEDKNGKTPFPGDQYLEQKQPPQHPLSSDELGNSHNSWFSKINWKHVRKLSTESTNLSNDDVDAGYRLYSGGSSSRYGKNPTKVASRAVTGMVALNIVKACRISTPSDLSSKDKRKKIKVFCSIDSDGIRQACTGVKKGFDNFQWSESFEIEFQRSKEIKIIVWIRSKKDGDRPIAEGSVALAQLLSDGCSEHLLALCLEPYGTLYIKLQFTEMKLLLQRTPSQKNEGVFGVSLETLLRRENGKIPIIVKKCVEEINDRGVEVTGIYRLCGNAAKKKVLRAQFENNSANVDLRHPDNPADVNVITGLLKDYLRELPQPLLSQDVREVLCKASEVEKRCEANDQFFVNEITKKFSRMFKDTIVYLLDHFAMVLMNSDVNKMDCHNLAVCIGPVLSCPSLGSMSPSAVSDTKKDINAIRLLLEIWPKPEQISAC